MTGATHDQLNRALGRVEGSQEAMEKRMDHLERTVTEGFKEVGQAVKKVADNVDGLRTDINERLLSLEADRTERKGAWKVITAIAAGVATVVATALSALKYLMG